MLFRALLSANVKTPNTAAAALILALAAVLGGCFGTRGPALPDLSTQRGTVDQRRVRLERIGQVIGRDLDRVAALGEQFIGADSTLYRPPFPLDLYKHVAVECLNEPVDTSADDSAGPGAPAGSDDPTGADDPTTGGRPPNHWSLECHPEFGRRLIVELHERVPARVDRARDQLRTLDTLRRLRSTLRHRFGRVRAIIAATRRMLASRRAELRQMRARQKRRRTEYSTDKWLDLQQRFDTYEQALDDLQRRVDDLAELRPTWGPTLDKRVSMLYTELTQLSP